MIDSDIGRGAGYKRAGHTHRSLPFSKSSGCIAKNWCFGRSTAITLSLRLT